MSRFDEVLVEGVREEGGGRCTMRPGCCLIRFHAKCDKELEQESRGSHYLAPSHLPPEEIEIYIPTKYTKNHLAGYCSHSLSFMSLAAKGHKEEFRENFGASIDKPTPRA